jgi:hypothetical protein
MAMAQTDKKIEPSAAFSCSRLLRSTSHARQEDVGVLEKHPQTRFKAESCERPNQAWNIALIIELTNARIRLVKETMLWVAVFVVVVGDTNSSDYNFVAYLPSLNAMSHRTDRDGSLA